MFVPILLCTARESNSSKHVANYVLEKTKQHCGFETELLSVKDFHLDATIAAWQEDSRKLDWQQTVEKADGLILVCPEYNHSFPGEFKLLIDTIFDEYQRKPWAVCTVSGGGIGGTRVAEQLNNLAIGLKMVPTPNPLYFTKVKELFDEDGKMVNEKYEERTQKFLEDFEWYVDALKQARNK
jgi:NAD(P)H-dependent FMN reductase